MNMFLLCLKIFLARIVDVSIGTFRTIIMVKGKSFLAAILAFVEVLIWFYVAREALNTNFNNFFIPLSYSLGYATGTFLGSILSKKIGNNIVGVEVVTKKNNKKLITSIRDEGYAISVIDLKNSFHEEKKDLLFIQTKSNSLKHLRSLIKENDKGAFVIVSDTKNVFNGYVK